MMMMMTFHALQGTLEHKGIDPLTGDPLFVVLLPNQGIAYELHTTQRTLNSLPERHSPCHVYVYTHIRPEEHKLVGFLARPERELFRLLMGANGVGLKMALSILEALPLSDLIEAILSENYKTLTVAKGVGNKLAQKMILDLKEKLALWQERILTHPQEAEQWQALIDGSAGASTAEFFNGKALNEAEQVLLSLGYEGGEVQTALKALMALCTSEETQQLNSEALLKALLKQLN
jgi:holliday junction DNA helicase RuvA